MSKYKIAIIFRRFGPYHHARLSAVASRTDLVAIELSSEDSIYAWQKIAASERFRQITLFEDEVAASSKTRKIAHRLWPILDLERPDVLVIPGWASPEALAALKWCVNTSTPALLMSESQESDEPRSWWKEALKSSIVRLFAGGFVGGTPHIDYLLKLGMPSDRIATGYDVVDNDYFASGAINTRREERAVRGRLELPEQYFLASSRFIEKKNLFRLLEAYAIYRRRCPGMAWDLVLLGDGPLKAELLKLREQLGARDSIHMPGFKQYDELPAYYGLAVAFIHASVVEPWGLVVNEAMAAGLPVLVSNRCGCAKDLVQEGTNGFTFDPFDTEQLAGFMTDFSLGKCDLPAMGRASSHIIMNVSPAIFADSLLRLSSFIGHGERKLKILDRLVLNVLLLR